MIWPRSRTTDQERVKLKSFQVWNPSLSRSESDTTNRQWRENERKQAAPLLAEMTSKDKSSWVIRSVSVTMLIIWCSAIFLGAAHSAFGVGECGPESKGGGCREASAHQDSNPTPQSPFCHDFDEGTRFRSILKAVSSPIVPHRKCGYAPSADQAEASFKSVFRQAQADPPRCMPEVYIGPASRSLAPPSIRA